MQYTEIFKAAKIKKISVYFFYYIFPIFTENIDCGYTLELGEVVLKSNHNLCLGLNLKKIGLPQVCKPKFYCIYVGFQGYTFHGSVFLMIALP